MMKSQDYNQFANNLDQVRIQCLEQVIRNTKSKSAKIGLESQIDRIRKDIENRSKV